MTLLRPCVLSLCDQDLPSLCLRLLVCDFDRYQRHVVVGEVMTEMSKTHGRSRVILQNYRTTSYIYKVNLVLFLSTPSLKTLSAIWTLISSSSFLSTPVPQEDGVRENHLLTLIILALWTASLLQFTLVLTATKSKRMRTVLFRSGSTASAMSGSGKSCCPTEVRKSVLEEIGRVWV